MPHPNHSAYSQTTPGTTLSTGLVSQTNQETVNEDGTARAGTAVSAFNFSATGEGLATFNVSESIASKFTQKVYVDSTPNNITRIFNASGTWHLSVDIPNSRLTLSWNGNTTSSAVSSLPLDEVFDLELEWTTWAANDQDVIVRVNGVAVITYNYTGVSFNPSQNIRVGGTSGGGQGFVGFMYDIQHFLEQTSTATDSWSLRETPGGSSPYTIPNTITPARPGTLTDASGSWTTVPGT